jgi:hypothetical protein
MRERSVYGWLVERGEPATCDVIARGVRMSAGRVRIALHAMLRHGLVRTRNEVLWSAVPNLNGDNRDDTWAAVWAESKSMRAEGAFGWNTDKPQSVRHRS